MEAHRKPNKGPQTKALQSSCFETLYGGARGGGKTDAGLARLLYDIENPKLRQLVIRRNANDLSDWIDRAREMYRPLNAEITGSSAIIKFPSGAIIRTGHLKDESAYTKYQGHEYHRILIEELTQIPTEEAYMKLISSCRSTVDGLEPRIFATTNPGNIGHKRVKNRFVIKELPGNIFKDHISGRTRVFIPAKVEDNPILMDKDPSYVKMLDALPEELKKAWRDGSWDIYDTKGAYYSRLVTETRKEGRISSGLYEKGQPVYTVRDLGVSDTMTVGLFQFIGKEIRVIDCLYGNDEGLDHYFNILRELTTTKGYQYEQHFAPHDIRQRELTSGMSRLEIAESRGYKFEITPSMQVKDGIDALKIIFNKIRFEKGNANIELLIDALSQYRAKYDENNDIFLKPVHDWTSHFADMMRYMAINYNNIVNATKIQEMPDIDYGDYLL